MKRYFISIEKYDGKVDHGIHGYLTDVDLAIQIVLKTVWHTKTDYMHIRWVKVYDEQGATILAYSPPVGAVR